MSSNVFQLPEQVRSAADRVSGVGTEQESLSFLEFFKILDRRKYIIGITTAVLTAIAVFFIMQLEDVYTSTALVLIEAPSNNTFDVEDIISGTPPDNEIFESQMELIKTRALAEAVVDELGLDTDPEFNAALRPETMTGNLTGLIGSVTSFIFGGSDKEEDPLQLGLNPTESSLEQDKLRQLSVVKNFMDNVDIARKGESLVIEISFTSKNPRTSTDAANAIANAYIVQQLESKLDATRRINDWLSRRISEMQEQVQAAENAVEAFKRESGLLEAKGVSLTSQQIAELNTQLVLARTSQSEAEARLLQVKRLMNSSRGVWAVTEVLDSPLIQDLRKRETAIQQRVAELSSEYGRRHPTMMNAVAELSDVRRKIQAEVGKIIGSLEYDVDVARARTASLEEDLEKLKNRSAELNTSEVQLRALERESNASRTLLESFLATFKQVGAKADFDIQQSDARIVSEAPLRLAPSGPNRKLMLAVAFSGAFVIGVLAALGAEHLNQGFRSSDEIEKISGVSVLSLMPQVTNAKLRARSVADHILSEPLSPLSESIRTLNTSLTLSNVDQPPQTIMFTSAQPGEAKSTGSLSLARLQASSGKRVIVIDADLRRPRIHVMLGMKRAPGLVEVVAGKCSLHQAVKTDKGSGLHVLSAGAEVTNAPDLLSSNNMKELLNQLAESYDMVIIDSPPVLAVTDARIIARYVDGVVFALRWAKTRRQVAVHALNQLQKTGCHISGILLTRVDTTQHAKYDYGDSGYYEGKIKAYYRG